MFLRNYWYVAAAEEEVLQRPLGRTILGEPVVLFRTEDGTPGALEDRCAHRRLPLSMGKIIGDALQCHYHGLRFDRAGQCVRVPGQDLIPPQARVRSYPLVERYRWLWIWMGDPAHADPDQITDFHWFADKAWGAKHAFLRLDVGATPTGTGAPQGRRVNGISMRNLNAITPETETTSHYFWGQAHDWGVGNKALTDMLVDQLTTAFHEDGAVFEGQQRNMTLMPNAPQIDINADSGVIAGRRILERIYREEQATAAA